jgi:Uncharacterized protein conserved in bacteria (DUF2252)
MRRNSRKIDPDDMRAAMEREILKRLVAFFDLAARSNGFFDQDGRDAAGACAASYRHAMWDFTAMDVLDIWYARLDDGDFLARLPKERKTMLPRRIAKAMSRSSSELVFRGGNRRRAAEHEAGAIGRVRRQRAGHQSETFLRARQHRFRCRDLGAPAGGRRLYIDNEGVICVDQIVARTASSNTSRKMSLSRKRPCRFFENVE